MEKAIRDLLSASQLDTLRNAEFGSSLDALGVTGGLDKGLARLGHEDAIGREIARIRREQDIYGASSLHSSLLLGVPQSTLTALQDALGLHLTQDPHTAHLAEQLRTSHTSVEDAWRSAGLDSLQDQINRALDSQFTSSVVSQAEQLARTLEALRYPVSLESFRPASELLTAQILGLQTLGIPPEGAVATLGLTTSFTRLLESTNHITSDVSSGLRSLLEQEVPNFDSIAAYGKFLDVAGLNLPRQPRLRVLSKRERRQRLKAQVARNHPPPHVTKATKLVHKYEVTLRQVIDECMTFEYGADWAERRLEACGCKDLLGKWRNRTESNPLDHADFHHYIQIMTNSEHFERIFVLGFASATELETLLKQARLLRAQSHHARDFTQKDLLTMRAIWRTIEKGLFAFEPEFEIET